jgi:hypothetical protein
MSFVYPTPERATNIIQAAKEAAKDARDNWGDMSGSWAYGKLLGIRSSMQLLGHSEVAKMVDEIIQDYIEFSYERAGWPPLTSKTPAA